MTTPIDPSVGCISDGVCHRTAIGLSCVFIFRVKSLFFLKKRLDARLFVAQFGHDLLVHGFLNLRGLGLEIALHFPQRLKSVQQILSRQLGRLSCDLLRLGLRIKDAAVGNLNTCFGAARPLTHARDRVYDVHAVQHFAKHDVLAIQPRGVARADEELAAVRVRAIIRHTECSRSAMGHGEVLVREASAVDRFTSCPIAVCEITTVDTVK